ADEFIDTRPIPNGLKAYLENIEAEFDCVGWSIVDYFDLPTDDQGERTVPKRMKMRDRLPHHSNFKILARGSLANRNVFIDAGQHKALIDGEVVSPYLDRQLVLAHYPRRSAWQMISKSIMGYLKVIAAGQSELQQNRSIHYKNIFQAMRDGPKGLLEPNFVNDTYDDRDLVEDPIPYLGKPLRYTPAGEPLLKAIRVLTAYAEQLAEHHGMFIDTNEGVRMQAERTTAEWTVLF
ncbi:MAG TPA: hypothetical protein VH722_15260, partial [Alphaproteobacteria bacterium]|nr:hypothetical protein [Alphaproteobacteria bacterium]